VRRYRSIAALRRDNAACVRCSDAGYPIAPPPVLGAVHGQRAFLFGLAPGALEAAAGRPWRGRAGRALRRWLRLDEEELERVFYCGSVTRCFPGRAAAGRGDRAATAEEQRLCASWAEEELRLLRPALVVTVGAVAARRLLGVERLADAVGKSFAFGEAVAVPLPHPSGASGWLNEPANRARLGKALTHVRREIAGLAEPER